MNACMCGHQPDDHTAAGYCNEMDGETPCSCSRYEWQGD